MVKSLGARNLKDINIDMEAYMLIHSNGKIGQSS
jgi:hypothetical protein